MLSLNYSEERRAFYGNGTFPCLCGHSRLLLTHRHSPEMCRNILIVLHCLCKRLVRAVLIFTESSDQLSRATDRAPGLPASPGYVQ
ncbi:hypothetical protein A7589_22170 [Escherichia sp. MOD1-EC6475]|nr:hypothetical protein A7589_22170 [Escherichia sp. MOD1-EC6475]